MSSTHAKDLASGTLYESISASTTTILVYVGEGSAASITGVWPDVPFYASIMPSNPSAGVPNSLDSEIVKVTAVGNDQLGNVSLTVVRAQRGTTSKAFTAGAIVTSAVYAEDAVLLGPDGTTESPSPWIETGDIVDGAVNTAKLANGAVTNAKIADGTVKAPKIDYDSTGTYYIFSSTSATTTSSWEGKTLDSTTCTFSNADVGGVYEVECLLTYAYPNVNLGEIDFGFNTTGCAVLANIMDYQIGNSAGEGRMRNWRYLVQATSTSISATVVVITSAAATITINNGYTTIRRVG